MDGTWRLHHRELKYVVCPMCNKLVPEKDLIKNGKLLTCPRCDLTE